MNKDQLVRALAAKFEMSNVKAKEIVDAIFSSEPGEGIIAVELVAGRKVSLQGFGTFRLTNTKARVAKAFGKEFEVPEKRKVRFKASKNLQERVASNVE